MRAQRGDVNVVAVVLVVMGTLLAVSVAGNAYFWHERDALVRKEATVTQLQADTKAAVQVCTASVDNLARQGKQRDKRIEDKLASIAPQVKLDQQEALKALGARPDDPKDLCGSLDRFRKAAEAKDGRKP